MPASSHDLHISPTGNDRWTGRFPEPTPDGRDGPLATLQQAQLLLRLAKRLGCFPGPLTVWLRGGRYELTKPLRFQVEDSAPVTWSAWPGETPVLDGGAPISGWTEVGSCWRADVGTLLRQRGGFRQLFVDGQRFTPAPWPRQGRLWVDGALGRNGEQRQRVLHLALGDLPPDADPLGADLLVHYVFSAERVRVTGWDAGRNELTLDRPLGWPLGGTGPIPWQAHLRFEGVAGLPLEPGEWRLEGEQVVLQPLPGQQLGSVTVVAALLPQLLRIEGQPDVRRFVEQLRFRGLSFRHSGWEPVGYSTQSDPGVPAAIFAEGFQHGAIEDCVIEHGGGYGIELADGCWGLRIIGNRIQDMGGGGIRVRGACPLWHEAPRQIAAPAPAASATSPAWAGGQPAAPQAPDLHARVSGRIRISDNVCSALGRVFPASSGIFIQEAAACEVRHNRVSDLYYSAICLGWQWGFGGNVCRDHRIEHNHCFKVGQGRLGDLAGIYVLGYQPGTVIRGNLVHDVQAEHFGAFGINLDEGSSQVLIEGNVIRDVGGQCLHLHFGRENQLRGNVFAFGAQGLIGISRGSAQVWPEKSAFADGHCTRVLTLDGNLLLSDGQPIFLGALGDETGKLATRCFASFGNLVWDVQGAPFSGDGVHGRDGREGLSCTYEWADWRRLGFEAHSVVADPRCRDLAQRDLRILGDSPLSDLGIVMPDVSRVGPRPAAERDELFPFPHPTTV